MREVKNRNLYPHFLKYALIVLNVEDVASIQQLVAGLMAEMKIEKESEVKSMINMAVEEGFLVLENKKRRKSSAQHNSSDGNSTFVPFYRFPKGSEIKKIMKMDPYCFECHLPHKVVKCKNCKRSFHDNCVRSHPEKPLYEPPSGKKQKNRPPAYNSEDECNDYRNTSNFRSLSSLTNPDESTTIAENENTNQNDNVNENDNDNESDNQNNDGNENTNDNENDNEITNVNDNVNQNQNENKENPNDNLKETPNETPNEPEQREDTVSHREENVEENPPVVSSVLNVAIDIDIIDNENLLIEHKPKIEDIKPEISIEPESVRNENEIKGDVLYIGQVRKPSRRRHTSVKTENNCDHNETVGEDNQKGLCTCCQLMNYADIRNPPNRQIDEISYLLNFTFQTNHSWLSYDVKRYIENKKALPEQAKELCNLLFVQPFISLDFIENKLKEKKYGSLNQFLVDILDLQHVMGVFFGDQSCEYEQTKWLVRDLQHDLAEIRRCPDCYRYSNEKVCSLWFALPCVQRHELVYAKQSGFPYWPAKVIRVLPNGKYDVRFFGPYHSRALVNPRCIKPLDTPTKSLKMGSSGAIRKAMDELKYHTDLKARFTPDQFAFGSDPQYVNKIVNNLTEQYRLNVNVVPPLLNLIPSTIYESLSVVHTLEAREGFAQAKAQTNGIKNGRKRKSTDGKCYIISPLDSHIICLDGTAPTQRPTSNPNDDNNASTDGPSTSAEAATIPNTTNSANSGSSVPLTPMPKRRVAARKLMKIEQALEKLQDTERELASAHSEVSSLQRRLEKRDKLVQQLKAKIQALEVLIRINKRKQWCQWCYEEAKYLCCFTGTYCSTECQSLHWDAGHESTCTTNDP